ncbi:MAG: hypothetical protein ACRDHN_08355, partial [Thermomicrobiales bacterium]
MRLNRKQLVPFALASMLSLPFAGVANADSSGTGTFTITATVDTTLTVAVTPDSTTIPAEAGVCTAAAAPVYVTITSNAPYIGSINASSSGPIPVTALTRDGSGAQDCGVTAGVQMVDGVNPWITSPEAATDEDGDTYAQYFSMQPGFG